MAEKKQSEIITRYVQILHETLHEVRPEDQDRVLDNFVEVLRQENHLFLVDEIISEYSAVKNPHPHATENRSAIEHFNSIIRKDPELAKKVKLSDSQIFVVRHDQKD